MIRAPISPERARKLYDFFSLFYDHVVKLESGPRTRGLEVADVKEGNAVLEVGFGTGNTLIKLAEMVGERGEVLGIDFSSKMVEKTRKRLEELDLLDRVHLAFGDARKLPYGSDKFDIVFNSYMIDLIDTPEIPLVLSEFKRVLKPRGRLSLVNLSKGESWYTNMRLYEWIYRQWPSCLGGCRPVLTKPFLEGLGFRNVKREFMLAGHLMPSEIVYGEKP